MPQRRVCFVSVGRRGFIIGCMGGRDKQCRNTTEVTAVRNFRRIIMNSRLTREKQNCGASRNERAWNDAHNAGCYLHVTMPPFEMTGRPLKDKTIEIRIA